MLKQQCRVGAGGGGRGGGGGGGSRLMLQIMSRYYKLKRWSGSSSIRQTLEMFQCRGKPLREGVEHIIMGFSERTDTILNWTELS